MRAAAAAGTRSQIDVVWLWQNILYPTTFVLSVPTCTSFRYVSFVRSRVSEDRAPNGGECGFINKRAAT